MELNYTVQNYEWGKRGKESRVAFLKANADSTFKIEENVPYSELWLGTHVNGPSSLKNGETLSNLISQHPEYLGENVRKQFGDQLPFLFKVLSVNQALSIQAHPAKEHAEELHRNQPDIYKDPNHKPELAIALTSFEALCGFRPFPEIYKAITNIPELKELIGDEILGLYDNKDPDLIRDAFRAVLTSPKEKIKEQLQNLLNRFKSLDCKTRQEQMADLVRRLYKFYPDDVGCFVVYFLNHVILRPFQAIYLAANVPHAYLFGDCIECMACSDNVVRAGLTPKYIDVETLCSMLDYKEPRAITFDPEIEDMNCHVFKPPVPDFAVAEIKVPKSLEFYKIPKRDSASTLLIVNGNAKADDILLIPGLALFLPAGDTFKVSDITEDLLIYQAFANV